MEDTTALYPLFQFVPVKTLGIVDGKTTILARDDLKRNAIAKISVDPTEKTIPKQNLWNVAVPSTAENLTVNIKDYSNQKITYDLKFTMQHQIEIEIELAQVNHNKSDKLISIQQSHLIQSQRNDFENLTHRMIREQYSSYISTVNKQALNFQNC
jgi:hypothetical protein